MYVKETVHMCCLIPGVMNYKITRFTIFNAVIRYHCLSLEEKKTVNINISRFCYDMNFQSMELENIKFLI
jgi:hypothetical protein